MSTSKWPYATDFCGDGKACAGINPGRKPEWPWQRFVRAMGGVPIGTSNARLRSNRHKPPFPLPKTGNYLLTGREGITKVVALFFARS
jgi:hypothetical protein